MVYAILDFAVQSLDFVVREIYIARARLDSNPMYRLARLKR